MLTYDFSVKEGVSNTIQIPCTLPVGTLVGHLYTSQRSDSQGSELAGTVTFNAGSSLAIITLTGAQATSSNFPALYTLTVSASGGAETILSAGRAGFIPVNPPVDDSSITSEVTRATTAEGNLSTALNTETGRATAAEALAEKFLVPTTVKTANYTAAPFEFVVVDTTTGNVTVTLPTNPADKTQIGVKHVVRGGTNTVTIAAGGTNRFNSAGGSTTASLSILREAATFQYSSATGLWYAISNDLPLSQLPAPVTGYTLASRPAATGSQAVIWVSDRNGGQLQQDTASGVWTDLSPGMTQAATPALVASSSITANFTTASTTDVDVTGLVVTFTAVAGATYQLMFRGTVGNTVSGATATASLTDSANTVLDTNGYVTRSANDTIGMTFISLVTPGAGSVTYKMRLKASANTAFILAGATFPARLNALRVA